MSTSSSSPAQRLDQDVPSNVNGLSPGVIETQAVMRVVEKAVDKEIQDLPAKTSDIYMMAIMTIGVAVFMVKHLVLPVIEARKERDSGVSSSKEDPAQANRANALILKEDLDGIPYIQSIPKCLRDFTAQITIMNETLTKLYNHHTDLLREIGRQSQEARKEAAMTNEKIDDLLTHHHK